MPTTPETRPLNMPLHRAECDGHRGPAVSRRSAFRALGRCGAAAVLWPASRVAAADDPAAASASRSRMAETTVRISGAGAATTTMNSALATLAQRGVATPTRVVSHLGTIGSLRAVEQGALDLAFINRPLLPDERMRGLQAVEYGRTPFVVMTSMPNVGNLTRKQLADFIDDPAATWPDGTPVRVVLRPRNDGDFALLASMGALVELALERAQARDGMLVAVTDQEATDAVARLRGGLGTCGLAMLQPGMHRLVPLALDGVAPTVANVENASYRIVNRMHIATNGPAKGLALELIQHLRSPAGTELLARLGHSTRFAR
jgi:phosphate transport system substrate-binding protein